MTRARVQQRQQPRSRAAGRPRPPWALAASPMWCTRPPRCRASRTFGQVLMPYAAVVSASTPVAMRYLYRTEQPPVPAVLAAVQTGLAAAILCVLCGSWWLLSGLRGGVGGPKAGARAPRQGLRDAEAPQHDDSASSIKSHEVRVLQHVLHGECRRGRTCVAARCCRGAVD